jgi:hypothetical protein
MSAPIAAYCLDWHVSKSDAFRDLLVRPLGDFCDIELVSWDGEDLPPYSDEGRPTIFCQLPPPANWLEREDARIIWIPMWDQARGYETEWWHALPKTLRIVAFSEEVAKRSRDAGLPTLRLQYFGDPAHHEPVTWDKGRTVFYWNRTGMVGPQFLSELCAAVSARKLLFLSDIDPGVDPAARYELPQQLGQTEVSELKFSNLDDFLPDARAAHVTLAPRMAEGVGLTFLEAMARGSAVFAFDGPTMNEYIVHAKNGILFANPTPSSSIVDRMRRRRTRVVPSTDPFPVSHLQNWERIARLDLEGLGRRARADHAEGFRRWDESRAAYAEFILS